MKNLKFILSLLMISLSMMFLASAFGVSAPCWEGNPVTVSPGEETVVNLNLQNGAGATDAVTVKVDVLEGKDIASLSQEQYVIAAGGSQNIPLTLSIPSSAKAGDSYVFKVEAKTITAGVSGGVSMGLGMKVTCNAIVTLPAKAKSNNTLYLIVIIAVLAIAVYFLTRKKK